MLNVSYWKEFVENCAKDGSENASLAEHRSKVLENISSIPEPVLKYGQAIKMEFPQVDFKKLQPGKEGGLMTAYVVDDKFEAIKPGARNVQVTDIKSADDKVLKLVSDYLFSEIDCQENMLTALHTLALQRCVVVYVPKGISSKDVAIHLPQWEANVQSTHVLIVADENSSSKISLWHGVDPKTSEMPDTTSTGSLDTFFVEVIANKGSKVNVCTVQAVGSTSDMVSYKKANCRDGATVHWNDIHLGGRCVKTEILSKLQKQAQSDIMGGFFANNREVYDIYTHARHAGDGSQSNMLVKGAQEGKSRSIYRGNIEINLGAKGCNGYQKEEVQLLSKDAKADSIPILNIANNDVACSHGVTLGQLDESKLFYLMSRGLSEHLSKLLVVESHISPMISLLKNRLLEKVCRTILVNKLGDCVEENIRADVTESFHELLRGEIGGN